MTIEVRLRAVLDAVLALIASRPDVAEFVGPLPKRFPFAPQQPRQRNVQRLIARLEPPYETADLIHAIQYASDDLRWNATYSEAEVGADFLARYGWFDIAGPHGPFLLDGKRIMAGYWDTGLNYAVHWHEAEEIYVPIAGHALFWSERNGEHVRGVGESVAHLSNEKHSAMMTDAPLFSLAIWRGADLAVNPTIITDTGEAVTMAEVRP